MAIEFMGAFFTNLQVRKSSAKAVSAALAKLIEGGAYVSPQSGDWVTVYAEDSEQQNDKIETLASGLSRMLKTDVLGFLVHDSDIAMYWLYRNGELVDEFNSAPDYFGEDIGEEGRARLSGSTEALLPLCVGGTTAEQLEEVLHPPDGFPIMAEDICGELATLLGIDAERAMLGFTYFENEGEEILTDAADFEPVGEGAERIEPGKITTVDFGRLPAVEPDTYPIAIHMLTQTWNPKQAGSLQAFAWFGKDTDSMAKQMRDGFDRSARDLLKKSKVPGLPTLEELKAARDQGPEALAELIARRTPDQLTDIGLGAALSALEDFTAALLKRGLDPTAANPHGRTTLSAAEQHGKNSAIYRLVKAAADGKK